MSDPPVEGTLAKPLRLDPFQRLIEVQWGGPVGWLECIGPDRSNPLLEPPVTPPFIVIIPVGTIFGVSNAPTFIVGFANASPIFEDVPGAWGGPLILGGPPGGYQERQPIPGPWSVGLVKPDAHGYPGWVFDDPDTWPLYDDWYAWWVDTHTDAENQVVIIDPYAYHQSRVIVSGYRRRTSWLVNFKALKAIVPEGFVRVMGNPNLTGIPEEFWHYYDGQIMNFTLKVFPWGVNFLMAAGLQLIPTLAPRVVAEFACPYDQLGELMRFNSAGIL